MRSLTTTIATSLATLALGGSLLACSSAAEDAEDQDLSFIDEGKADDFYSVTAREYVITGRTSVTLDESFANSSDAEKRAEVQKLIGYKQIAIAWFLTQYLVDKEDENASFGGFGGMAKAGAYEDFDVTPRADGLTFDFNFKQLAAGKHEMLDLLPLRSENGKQVFDLEIGTPSNEELAELETNNEWYRSAPWTDWNPANVPANKKTQMTFTIERERDSTDGYIDLERLAADGKIDIDVYFGWDYHAEYHIKHAQALFTWLQSEGFRAPATSFSTLTKDSGAFTRTVKADGRSISVEVRMYYGKPGTATDPDTDDGGRVLEDLAMSSLKTRDVIVYSGHSGPFYGFALANWKKTAEGDLDDADMRVADMPADRYQLVFANGCDTYQIGTAFKENPNKRGKNIDVITSTSFSNAGTPHTVTEFISHLLNRKSDNTLQPREVSGLLTRLDNTSGWFDTMYGMHGIDDNPTLVPFADRSTFGKSCTASSQCGGPGSLCVGPSGAKTCTAACTADAGCGDGYTCKPVANVATATVYGKACARSN